MNNIEREQKGRRRHVTSEENYMFISKGDYIKILCENNHTLDGKIEDICLTNDNGVLDANIFLVQQKDSEVEPFGSAVVPLSYIKSILL